MTTTAANKRLVEILLDGLNDRDLDVLDEVCADGFAADIGLKGTDERAVGLDDVKAMYEGYYAAFPNYRHEVDAMVAEGDLVAVFMTTRGTHEGPFRGVPPTGNEVAIEDTGLVQVVDGEIATVRPLADMLGLFEQLGVSLDLAAES